MATTQTKETQAISPAANQAEVVTVSAELPIIIDPTPIPPPPKLDITNPLPVPADPFVYSDIKEIFRVPAGFQCQVKFDQQNGYLPFLASADDLMAHGRAIYEECASGKWGKTPDYMPSAAELLASAQDRITTELRRADGQVTIYQDRVDIDDATDADRAQLKAWKTYRVALNKLDQQQGWPTSITWPIAPAA